MIIAARGGVGGSVSNGCYNGCIGRIIGEEVLQCSLEEVERCCRHWCVCCCNLSLLLHLPDFGVYGQVMGLQSSTSTIVCLPYQEGGTSRMAYMNSCICISCGAKYG
eukprot:4737803-Ditylum_brightwellii.AAC.1